MDFKDYPYQAGCLRTDRAASPSFWDFFFDSKPERVRKLVKTVRTWRQQQARAANTFLMGSFARPTATKTEPEIDLDVINVDVSVDSTYDWSLLATLPTGGLPVNRLSLAVFVSLRPELEVADFILARGTH